MADVQTYIESGILEMYVLGVTSNEENKEVVQMAALHADIQKEIDRINATLFDYLHWHGIKPLPKVRDKLLELIGRGCNSRSIK